VKTAMIGIGQAEPIQPFEAVTVTAGYRIK